MPAIQSHALRLFLGAAVAVAAAGCQPMAPEAEEIRLAGQVFVVTPSGESLRLGSVRVQVIDEEQVERHLQEREEALTSRREALGQELVGLRERERQQNDAVARADRAYLQREAEIRRELGAFIQEVEARAAEFQRQIEANTAFIETRDVLPPPPEGVPTREESQAYERLRRQWLSMTRPERVAWAEALTALNLELEEKIEQLASARDEKVFAFGDELQALDVTLHAAQEELQKTRKSIAAVAAELEAPLRPSDFLAGLPAPAAEVRTDADGEFVLHLPARRSYVVLAETERRLGGERKEFTWFVRVGDRPQSRILLSNHNLVTSDSAENVMDRSFAAGASDT